MKKIYLASLLYISLSAIHVFGDIFNESFRFTAISFAYAITGTEENSTIFQSVVVTPDPLNMTVNSDGTALFSYLGSDYTLSWDRIPDLGDSQYFPNGVLVSAYPQAIYLYNENEFFGVLQLFTIDGVNGKANIVRLLLEANDENTLYITDHVITEITIF
jgi:hypothetical protein